MNLAQDNELEYFVKLEILNRLNAKKEIWNRHKLKLEIEDSKDPMLQIVINELDGLEEEIRILEDQIAFLQYGGT